MRFRLVAAHAFVARSAVPEVAVDVVRLLGAIARLSVPGAVVEPKPLGFGACALHRRRERVAPDAIVSAVCIHGLAQFQECAHRHLNATGWREHHRQIACVDPTAQGLVVYAEHARRKPARHRRAQLALQRTADLGDVAVAGQLAADPAQPQDVLDEILSAIHYTHGPQGFMRVPIFRRFWGLMLRAMCCPRATRTRHQDARPQQISTAR